MNEDPKLPVEEERTVNIQSQTPLVQKKSILPKLIVALLSLLFILSAAYGVYAYMQINQKNREINTLKAENNALSVASKAKPADTVNKSDTLSDTLPNGKALTYPDNDGNRNILYWYASRDANMPNTLYLSHKGIQQFISSVDSETLAQVCGTYTDLKAVRYEISVAAFDVSTRSRTNPQSASCLDMLASEANPSVSLRQEAKAQIAKINDDVAQFIQSVQVK